MKYYFDTEFIEDGKTIDLISIGIVAEDGREYYAISAEFDETKANNWVKTNVLSHLPPRPTRPYDEVWKMKKQIREEILDFVGQDQPEFWAYYADYDWVVLCQLFGTMMDLPKGWPMYCRDLKQWCDFLGNPKLPKQKEAEHHALNDAKWIKKCWDFLNMLS